MATGVNDSADDAVHVPGAAFAVVPRCSGCASEALDSRALYSGDGRTVLCADCYATALDAIAARSVEQQVSESPPVAAPAAPVKPNAATAIADAPRTGPCSHRYLSPTGDYVSLASARAVKARCALCNEAAA